MSNTFTRRIKLVPSSDADYTPFTLTYCVVSLRESASCECFPLCSASFCGNDWWRHWSWLMSGFAARAYTSNRHFNYNEASMSCANLSTRDFPPIPLKIVIDFLLVMMLTLRWPCHTYMWNITWLDVINSKDTRNQLTIRRQALSLDHYHEKTNHRWPTSDGEWEIYIFLLKRTSMNCNEKNPNKRVNYKDEFKNIKRTNPSASNFT